MALAFGLSVLVGLAVLTFWDDVRGSRLFRPRPRVPDLRRPATGAQETREAGLVRELISGTITPETYRELMSVLAHDGARPTTDAG